jgi:hypothetical protein
MGDIIPPPGSDPNPPAARVSGKQQALKQLKLIKKQIDGIEKWIKTLPNKPPAKNK